MAITQLICRDFPVTDLSAEIGSVIGQLSSSGAVIVQGSDKSAPAGVLTMADVSLKKGKHVKDCLQEKPMTDLGNSWPEMLSLLHKTPSDVLIVMNDRHFEGLIWREDLLAFLRSPYHSYKKAGQQAAAMRQLSGAKTRIMENDKILKALYNNSSAVRLLLAEDYSILYLNKATEEKSYLFHNDQIKEGDNALDYLYQWFEQANEGFTEHFKAMVDLAITGENTVEEVPVKFSLEPFRQIVLWFRIACFAVWDEGVLLGISVTVTDINERKKHELFIQNQNRILTEIIYTQSHEVRGPLSNILGIIAMMEDMPSAATDPELIQWLKTSAQNLDKMVTGIVSKAGEWRHKEG